MKEIAFFSIEYELVKNINVFSEHAIILLK